MRPPMRQIPVERFFFPEPAETRLAAAEKLSKGPTLTPEELEEYLEEMLETITS